MKPASAEEVPEDHLVLNYSFYLFEIQLLFARALNGNLQKRIAAVSDAVVDLVIRLPELDPLRFAFRKRVDLKLTQLTQGPYCQRRILSRHFNYSHWATAARSLRTVVEDHRNRWRPDLQAHLGLVRKWRRLALRELPLKRNVAAESGDGFSARRIQRQWLLRHSIRYTLTIA